MSNIQHLIENGLGIYGKMSAEEWEEKMLQDPNWQPWIAITIDELYEICSYVENTHVAMLNETIEDYENLCAELVKELEDARSRRYN